MLRIQTEQPLAKFVSSLGEAGGRQHHGVYGRSPVPNEGLLDAGFEVMNRIRTHGPFAKNGRRVDYRKNRRGREVRIKDGAQVGHAPPPVSYTSRDLDAVLARLGYGVRRKRP